MGLADLANYYWLGERVLTVADECARRATARRKCGPIGFGPQFIDEPWLRKCIGRSAKRGYSENRRIVRSERLYAKSIAVNVKWRVWKRRGKI